MKLYLYAKSGHSVGLDATRRCAAVASQLQEFDPIFCTSDFRAGAYAKEELGIKKYVSIDVISNLTNIMEKNDILIYETPEANENIEKQMKMYCSSLYKIGREIPTTIVNEKAFDNAQNKEIEKLIFFGDDDYNEIFLNACNKANKTDIPLLLGHYFFLGNEKKFEPIFSELLEDEDYLSSIKSAKHLLTGSLNACIESITYGNKPVLIKRSDKIYDEQQISTLNIPTIKEDSLNNMLNEFEQIINDYCPTKALQSIDLTSIKEEIKTKIDNFNKIVKV